MHLNNNKITGLTNFTTLVTIVQLDLRSNRIASLQEAGPLLGIQWLSLSSNVLTNITGFPLMPQLKYVGLFANFLEVPLEPLLNEIQIQSPLIMRIFLAGNQSIEIENCNEIFEKFHILNESCGF